MAPQWDSASCSAIERSLNFLEMEVRSLDDWIVSLHSTRSHHRSADRGWRETLDISHSVTESAAPIRV
jgi:hypothetical protein